MTAPQGRHDALRDLCAHTHDDDGLEGTHDLRRHRGDRPATTRKDLQLCAQAARALNDALAAACADPILKAITITRVEPAPNASRLRAYAAAAPGSPTSSPHEALAHLRAAKGLLRAHVAHAITRKRTPDLIFDWDSTSEHARENTENHHDHHD